ncbi:type II toxin-antitoxin system prevent-host-death family antitoxin [Streptomyces sp. AcH 505]|uniref:type II toxin-antitoxin system prevent-host-death family antitoxin n=1 Tax=Streptomyces sp. AcH 505 TaxID=352211 RepID=UPI00099DDB4F
MAEYSSDNLRIKLAEALNTVIYGNESVTVTRYGKPVAMLVRIDTDQRADSTDEHE